MAKHDLFHLGQVGLAGNIDHLSNFLEIPPPKQKGLWLLAATYVRIGSSTAAPTLSRRGRKTPHSGRGRGRAQGIRSPQRRSDLLSSRHATYAPLPAALVDWL